MGGRGRRRRWTASAYRKILAQDGIQHWRETDKLAAGLCCFELRLRLIIESYQATQRTKRRCRSPADERAEVQRNRHGHVVDVHAHGPPQIGMAEVEVAFASCDLRAATLDHLSVVVPCRPSQNVWP